MLLIIVLLRVNQINDFEYALCIISETDVLSFVQSLCAYGFDYAKRTLFVSTAAAASRCEGSEVTRLATPRDLDEPASVVLIYGRYRLQALRYLQNAGMSFELSLLCCYGASHNTTAAKS